MQETIIEEVHEVVILEQEQPEVDIPQVLELEHEDSDKILKSLQEAKTGITQMVENYIAELRILHQGIIDDKANNPESKVTNEQLVSSHIVVENIDLFNVPDRLKSFLLEHEREKNVSNAKFVKNSKRVSEFRRLARRSKIGGLKVIETIEALEKIDNLMVKNLMRGYLSAVIGRFDNMEIFTKYTPLLKFNFMLCRISCVSKIIPTIAFNLQPGLYQPKLEVTEEK